MFYFIWKSDLTLCILPNECHGLILAVRRSAGSLQHVKWEWTLAHLLEPWGLHSSLYKSSLVQKTSDDRGVRIKLNTGTHKKNPENSHVPKMSGPYCNTTWEFAVGLLSYNLMLLDENFGCSDPAFFMHKKNVCICAAWGSVNAGIVWVGVPHSTS